MAKPKPKQKPKPSNKSKKSKSSLMGKFFRFLTYIALLLLLLSNFARYVSPEIFWFPAFLGLAFPYLYILTLIIFVLWLVLRKRIAIYSFIVLLICFPLFYKFFNIFPKNNSTTDKEHSIRVMTFNVRTFNIYNQAHDKDKKSRRNKILKFIEEQSPDIVCFQESYFDTLHKYKTIDTLLTIEKSFNEHSFYSFKRNENKFGISTLSKLPILNKGILTFEENMKNLCIYTDVLYNEDTMRIYNAHFSSIGLSREDFVFIETIGALNIEEADSLLIKRSFRKIAGRLKRAFKERANQVEIVAEHIASSPYPSVLCADLNDTPSSYAYRILSNELTDAFLKSGRGIGKTYNGILPYFRIDYIFYSDWFGSFDFKTHYIDLSDHYPITLSLYKMK